MDKLFKDVTSLYRLDQISVSAAGGKADLGPLPSTAVALLSALAAAWVLILLWLLFDCLRKHRKNPESG